MKKARLNLGDLCLGVVNGFPPHPLADLRRRRQVAQNSLARVMGRSPAQVCNIERSDLWRLKLTTVYEYVRGLGGELEIWAVLDEGETRERVF
jgi:hypothetical protein